MKLKACLAFLLAAALAVGKSAAADTGIAYDSFTQFPADQFVDIMTIDPLSFNDGFTNASGTYLPGPGSNVSSQQANDALRSFRMYGIAARHYVLGGKRRVDDLSTKTSLITDCGNGTLTQIDNVAHTYHVVKNGSAAASQITYAIALKNASLGSESVDGITTQGFSSTATFVANGASAPKRTVTLKAYISKNPAPATVCAEGVPAGDSPAAQAQFFHDIALGISSGDPRFKVTRTGPRLPIGQMPLFIVLRVDPAPRRNKPVTAVIQNGHLRPLTAADAPLFSPPPGYTPI
jgi:hypothetical protein